MCNKMHGSLRGMSSAKVVSARKLDYWLQAWHSVRVQLSFRVIECDDLPTTFPTLHDKTFRSQYYGTAQESRVQIWDTADHLTIRGPQYSHLGGPTRLSQLGSLLDLFDGPREIGNTLHPLICFPTAAE